VNTDTCINEPATLAGERNPAESLIGPIVINPANSRKQVDPASRKNRVGQESDIGPGSCKLTGILAFLPPVATDLGKSASARFPAPQAGHIDLLARNTTWTMARELYYGVQFVGVLFYDGQGFMVAESAQSAG
jgi:hypothetical protein